MTKANALTFKTGAYKKIMKILRNMTEKRIFNNIKTVESEPNKIYITFLEVLHSYGKTSEATRTEPDTRSDADILSVICALDVKLQSQ